MNDENKTQNKEEQIIVPTFSNLAIYLMIAIMVLMWGIFELRLRSKDSDMENEIAILKAKIEVLEEFQGFKSKMTDKNSTNKQSKVAINKSFKKEQQTSIFDEEFLKNHEFVSWYQQRARDLGIEPKIVKTIIKIESGNNKYAIGLKSNNPSLVLNAFGGENVEISNKSNSKFISLIPKDEKSAERVFDLIEKNIDEWEISMVDYGLMQINRDTILAYELNPKEIYLNPHYNVAVGIDVLKSCYNLFPKNQFNTIECYNKGVDKRKLDNSNDYYNKFIEEFKRTI